MCKYCTLGAHFLGVSLLSFIKAVFQLNRRFIQYASLITFLKKVIQYLQHFPQSISHFLISLLAERQLTDGLRSLETGSLMYHLNVCKSACYLKLWKVWWKSGVKFLIAPQLISVSSFTIRRTQCLVGWLSLAKKNSCQRGYPSTCPPTMMAQGCNDDHFHG